jgi:hypothetical protein
MLTVMRRAANCAVAGTSTRTLHVPLAIARRRPLAPNTQTRGVRLVRVATPSLDVVTVGVMRRPTFSRVGTLRLRVGVFPGTAMVMRRSTGCTVADPGRAL